MSEKLSWSPLLDDEGKVKDPEIAQEMAEIEDAHRSKRRLFGLLGPSKSELKKGQEDSLNIGKSINFGKGIDTSRLDTPEEKERYEKEMQLLNQACSVFRESLRKNKDFLAFKVAYEKYYTKLETKHPDSKDQKMFVKPPSPTTRTTMPNLIYVGGEIEGRAVTVNLGEGGPYKYINRKKSKTGTMEHISEEKEAFQAPQFLMYLHLIINLKEQRQPIIVKYPGHDERTKYYALDEWPEVVNKLAKEIEEYNGWQKDPSKPSFHDYVNFPPNFP